MEHNGFKYNNIPDGQAQDGVYVGTFSGKKFHFMNPKPDEICMEDIAKALSHINRFGGHSNYPYSVGQHSLLIADKVRQEGYTPALELYALMHDFSEAYLTDLPTPIKRELPDYEKMEANVMKVIYKKFGMVEPNPFIRQLVKYYDTAILESEVKALCPRSTWTPPKMGIKFDIFPCNPKDIEHAILLNMESLLPKYKKC